VYTAGVTLSSCPVAFVVKSHHAFANPTSFIKGNHEDFAWLDSRSLVCIFASCDSGEFRLKKNNKQDETNSPMAMAPATARAA